MLGRSTLQITMAEGGIAPNMTPDRAQFLADIRIVPPLNEKEVLNRLKCLIEKRCDVYNGGLSFAPEISNYRMPVETGPKPVASQTERVYRRRCRGDRYQLFYRRFHFPDSLAGQSALLFGQESLRCAISPMNTWRYPSILRQLESWKNFAGTLLNSKLMI